MALFNGVKRQEGSRSHTHLIKSGHTSPATQWLLDQSFRHSSMSSVYNNGVLFNYQYGGPGMEEVVVPMGRLVGVAKAQRDFVDGTFKTVVTLPGLANNGNAVGVAPYNYTKDLLQEDRFGGNMPSVITIDYITLPYIPSVAPAATMDKAGLLDEEKRLSIDLKMPWGAVLGVVQEGDFVKATASGRFTKWNKASDHVADIVGKVLEMDLNGEPWGWEKWVLEDVQYRKEDDKVINRSGASNLPSDDGYPFDPVFRDGLNVFQNYQTNTVTNPTGIPGLHDGNGNYTGYGKNDTEYKDMALGEVPAGVADGSYIYLNAKDYAGGNLKNVKDVSAVKIDGTAVDVSRYTINYEKGLITLKVNAADSGKAVTATYKADHYGTPSYLDFKGVAGSVSILLQL